MKKLPSKNRALMQRIDTYLQNKMECSMGEIEEELGIPVWKQYVIYRSYRDFFPSVRLVDGRWSWDYRTLSEPVPQSSQDVLSVRESERE